EVTHSRVGPDGIIIGDIEYLPCMHENGFKPLPRTGDHNITDNYIQYHGLSLGQQGCIEFWYHPDWSGGQVGHVVEILDYGYLEDPGWHMIRISYNNWQNLLSFDVYDNYTDRNAIFIEVRPSSVPQWSTEHPFHIAIVWDGTAANTGDRLKLFFNGVQTGNASWYGDPTFAAWPTDMISSLGGRLFSGDWDRHKWEGSDGIIDNIKIWAYPKTDFSDRFKE
ncbi:MAG: hypothetical protein KAV42_06180, partial [Candidatus Krumholzibacteria bacterium]|nr:hypothetical protein [Candidatus Krumholzibacteria bacterium]